MKVWQRSRPKAPDSAPPPTLDRAQARAQRLAWSILAGAFLVWCALVLAGGISVRRYTLTAATPQQGNLLAIARGEIFYQDILSPNQARASNGMALTEGTVLEAAQQTEADLTLFEGSGLHLFPGSQVRLDALRVGQFSDYASRVDLSQDRGAVRYQVSGALPFIEGVTLTTPHGVFTLQRGEFLVWVHPDETVVTTYVGKGSVKIAAQLERFRFEQTIRVLANGTIESPGPMGENLVRNGTFALRQAEWEPIDEQEEGRKDVRGLRSLDEYLLNGQSIRALRVWRATDKDTHNETGLFQTIERDVTPYRNLFVRAWVRVDAASLSGGGYAGSEYPMMIQVEYTDTTGGRPMWTHGFYYSNPENRPVINAEQIPQSVWYYYQGDLTELKDRPAFIKTIRVLGSGHDFDATVTGIELLAQ